MWSRECSFRVANKCFYWGYSVGFLKVHPFPFLVSRYFLACINQSCHLWFLLEISLNFDQFSRITSFKLPIWQLYLSLTEVIKMNVWHLALGNENNISIKFNLQVRTFDTFLSHGSKPVLNSLYCQFWDLLTRLFAFYCRKWCQLDFLFIAGAGPTEYYNKVWWRLVHNCGTEQKSLKWVKHEIRGTMDTPLLGLPGEPPNLHRRSFTRLLEGVYFNFDSCTMKLLCIL